MWYANKTYWVSSSLSIDAGKTLRIEPGTFVKINADQQISSGGGKIIAKGTPYMRIVFTSASDDSNGESIPSGTGPHAGVTIGEWKRIRVLQSYLTIISHQFGAYD